MAITYSINGGSEIPGIVSSWERIYQRQNADGSIDYSSQAVNVWLAEMMTVSDFESLQTTLGASLASLETNDIDTRNTAATYTTVFLTGLRGVQQGRRMVDVEARFLVDTS